MIHYIVFSEKYCIKSGYRHSKKDYYFDDTNHCDEHQKEVYLDQVAQMVVCKTINP